MADREEDKGNRPGARPALPPFRGPGNTPRPPLTPPAGGPPTPRPLVQPPPAVGRPRSATPPAIPPRPVAPPPPPSAPPAPPANPAAKRPPSPAVTTTPPWSAEPPRPAAAPPAPERLPSIDALGYEPTAARPGADAPSPDSDLSPLPAWPGMTEPAEPGSPAEPPAWVEGEPADSASAASPFPPTGTEPGEPWATAPGTFAEPSEASTSLPDESPAAAAAHGDEVFGWGAPAPEAPPHAAAPGTGDATVEKTAAEEPTVAEPAVEEKVGLYGDSGPEEEPPLAADVVPETTAAEPVIGVAAPPAIAEAEEPVSPPAVSALQDTMAHPTARRSLYGDEAIYAAEPAEAWAHAAASTTGATDHVARALESLAARVRRGELPVGQVPTDASPAGVLAAVLAALLGVSERR